MIDQFLQNNNDFSIVPYIVLISTAFVFVLLCVFVIIDHYRPNIKTKQKKMIYSYKCKGKCKIVHDYVHGMNEKPIFTCCGKVMAKLITAPAAIIRR